MCNNPSLSNEVTAMAHSMIRALPEAESLAWSFGGEWRFETRAAFPEGVQFAAGMSKDSCALRCQEFRPDLVLMLNTHPDRMPVVTGDGIRAYYQTSPTGANYARVRDQVHRYFCVSKWLANQVEASEESVLFPPVESPQDVGKHNRTHIRLAGRAETTGPHRWKPESYMPYLKKAKEAEPRLFVEFLGQDPKRPEAWCLPGHTGHTEKYRMSQWDFMVHTPGVEEAYSRTVTEAMRVGCVPIALKKGGVPEQIVHGEDGFLVETPEDVAEAVFALKDDQVLKRMSENAKRSGDRMGSLKTWRTEFLKRLTGSSG